MVWLHVALLLQPSVARQVRVAVSVVPHKMLVIVSATTSVTLLPSQRSLATGASKSYGVPHATIRLETHAIAGAVESTTVMVWLHVAVLVQGSVACQVRVAEKVFPHRALVTVPTTTRVTFVPSQPAAVGASKSHAFPHSTVLLVA